jgi:hypothetical protein
MRSLQPADGQSACWPAADAARGCTAARTAPDPRLIVPPSHRGSHGKHRRARPRRRSRLPLWTAAATATTVIGVSAGVALASTPGSDETGTGTASGLAGMHAGASGSGQLGSTPVRGQGQSGETQAGGTRSHGVQPGRSGRNQSGRNQSRDQAAARATGKTRPHAAGTRQYPYLIYDSVDPGYVPASRVLAAYATGPFAVSAAEVAGHKAVMWIDVVGTDPAASAVDVEPGDVGPAVAASWVSRKLTSDHRALAIVYTSRAEWPSAQAAVNTLPAWMIARVRWWIADPTGYPHVLPGSSATQWYWGPAYDISTALPGF